ncbi:T9SS type A sorting domain-containing protein [Aestuariivivens marinum]|uniref:T9SS type A sorting domain-containing protein n=1 Tax=Aestuariivivens marinum TaxID=2913555 RepID=UPI001F56B172|nr:T9SS type A sorting domain-containing protein [Aestuariivivens marinum]
MKRQLHFFTILIFFVTPVLSQVTAGQIDDFENGTVLSWEEDGGAASSPNPPTNISTGGPNGANDNYLQNVSSGGFGAGSKMVMHNSSQWSGDFTNQGVIAVKFHAKALTNNLNLRVAFNGPGGQICTTNAVLVTAGNPWEEFTISISPSDFSLLSGATSITNTLQNVSTMRVLSSTSPSWRGDAIVATLEIDNIEALTTLSTEEFPKNTIGIFPNPTSSYINLKNIDQLDIQSIAITNVLGKQIVNTKVFQSGIDVSNLNQGLYFLHITLSGGKYTKRFIKQ